MCVQKVGDTVVAIAVVFHSPATADAEPVLVVAYPRKAWPRLWADRPVPKEQAGSVILGQGLAANVPAPQVVKIAIVEIKPEFVEATIQSISMDQKLEPDLTFLSETTQQEAWPTQLSPLELAAPLDPRGEDWVTGSEGVANAKAAGPSRGPPRMDAAGTSAASKAAAALVSPPAQGPPSRRATPAEDLDEAVVRSAAAAGVDLADLRKSSHLLAKPPGRLSPESKPPRSSKVNRPQPTKKKADPLDESQDEESEEDATAPAEQSLEKSIALLTQVVSSLAEAKAKPDRQRTLEDILGSGAPSLETGPDGQLSWGTARGAGKYL